MAFVTPTQGFVLCVGENGHVAMERTHDPRPCGGCLGDERHPEREGASWGSTDSDGCPCVDLPVLGGDFARGRHHATSTGLAADLVPALDYGLDLASPFSVPPSFRCLLAIRDVHLPPASLVQIRCTVLLI